ncbi:Glycerol-3-phosphate acyltransferase [Candidatus Erwinia haradaeae]|uniref:Glycerol-3-phosphate acyltransferase n=1 Tax=Candidatus Erwinia haradaeae TaxID=1922217 RepID=A0A803FT50_9GAMM|nr:Glycerol-3-phosphate acyltransferase [Candidatus Erwinia haradaeae]
MLDWRNLYYKLWTFFIRILVNSTVIPDNPIFELGISISQPVIYVLSNESEVDLFTLQAQCRKKNLPDPLGTWEIDDKKIPHVVFIHKKKRIFPDVFQFLDVVNLFHHILKLQRKYSGLDIQVVFVSIIFGRSLAYEKKNHNNTYVRVILNSIHKFLIVLFLGRNSFICFSRLDSLRDFTMDHQEEQRVSKGLIRVIRMYFFRQRLAVVGPDLPVRKNLFNQLLKSRVIKKAIEDEAYSKQISKEQAKKNAVDIMEEIASNPSNIVLYFTAPVMRWTWKRLYKSININGVERVRYLSQAGNEIVYVPCHRSHIDYLLLSYVLYNQGLVPPYIAAGINLNFWPVGSLFRHLGAFFIRRTFRGNKLYATVFRQYLINLFTSGASVEYFIEGGRSRTGYLLTPKTGILSITIQAMLRSGYRPIVFIPIYIGYEHIVESKTYANELRGTTKKTEGVISILRALCCLRNLGQSYINFGDPFVLEDYLTERIPDWRNDINALESQRPIWLTEIVDNIAQQIMIRINNAVVVNTMNLCSTALLASRTHSLSRQQLIIQLDCYISLLRNIPYSSELILPTMTSKELLDDALSMDKFDIFQDSIDDVIILKPKQAILATYYRNNISHILVIPSLIASIFMTNRVVSYFDLVQQIYVIYPFIKNELFLRWDTNDISKVLEMLIIEMEQQGLLIEEDSGFRLNPDNFHTLQILSEGSRIILQRYTIIFYLLSISSIIDRRVLKKQSQMIAQRLSVLSGINLLEYFDQVVFSSLVLTLRNQGYMRDLSCPNQERARQAYQLFSNLVDENIRIIIENVVKH